MRGMASGREKSFEAIRTEERSLFLFQGYMYISRNRLQNYTARCNYAVPRGGHLKCQQP